MNKVEALAALFGSKKAVAEALGMHAMSVYRWGDTVPREHNHKLLALNPMAGAFLEPNHIPNKVERLASLFGSQKALASAVPTHPSVVSVWAKRDKIPASKVGIILRAALDLGIDVNAVAECMAPPCPTCGKPL